MSEKDLTQRDVEVGPGASEFIATMERSDFLRQALKINLFEEVYVARWCIVHGIKYCKYLHVITAKSDDSSPIFQRIIYVIVTDATSIKLVTEEWDTVKCDRHTHTYAIQQLSTSLWSVIQLEDLYDYYPYHASKSYKDRDPLSYVVMRHRLH